MFTTILALVAIVLLVVAGAAMIQVMKGRTERTREVAGQLFIIFGSLGVITAIVAAITLVVR